MDESELRIAESLFCVQCGAPCRGRDEGDLLRYTCPQDGRRHALTVRSPAQCAAGEAPLAGRAVGSWRLERLAGYEGGLPLYRAAHGQKGTAATVRVLGAEAAKDEGRAEAFIRAGKLAAAARHPALAGVAQLFRAGGGLFAVSPALAGQPLDQVVSRGGPLEHDRAIALARSLAEGLAALRQKHVVHRNLGPHSVYLLPGGGPQVRNFAFAVPAGAPPEPLLVVGQPGFLAPEQATGEAVDVRADLYALGAVLYLLLAGVPPFQGSDPSEAIRQQLAGGPPPREPLVANGGEKLADLVVALLARDPAARPAGPAAVLEALDAAQAAAPAGEAAGAQGLGGLSLGEDELAVVEPDVEPQEAPAEEPTARVQGPPQSQDAAPADEQAAPPEEPQPKADAMLEFGPVDARQPEEPQAEDADLDNLALVPEAAQKAGDGSSIDFGLPPEEESKPKGRRRLVALLGIAAALLLAFAIFQVLTPDGDETSAEKPPAKEEAPSPGEPQAEGQPPRAEEPDEHEAAAKAQAAEIQRLAEGDDLAATLAACDAFLEEHADTSAAAAVEATRERTLERRAKQAEAQLPEAQRQLGDRSKPLPQRLEAADAFVQRYQGTEAAEKLAEQKAQLVERAEAAGEQALDGASDRLEKLLEQQAYGEAIALLEPLAAQHAGTDAGRRIAQRLAALRADVERRFAERKDRARVLVRECRFREAEAQMAPPREVWEVAELKAEAERVTGLIRMRRQRVVAATGRFLARYEPLVADCKFAEARDLAYREARGADHPAMVRLLQGKAVDAELLAAALDRVVAGARAVAQRAARAGEKLMIHQASGMGLEGTIREVSREGLEVDIPGLEGLLPWPRLARRQMLDFATQAEGELAPETRCGLGLLALLGDELGLACQQFAAAAEAGEGPREQVAECLRRNASRPIHVPGGVFLSGQRKQQRQLGGFCLGRWEVSNAEYALWLRIAAPEGVEPPPGWGVDAQPPAGREEEPVTGVTWAEADAYARWLGRRLPERAEWERAVRGTEGRLYPWGDDFEPRRANLQTAGGRESEPSLAAVTRRLARRETFPFLHLVGNAREWTATSPQMRGEPAEYFVVGGSAADPPREAQPHQAKRQKKDQRDPFTGFRLAWPR
ncbi:MAG: SUMF1/EgtB/PvdO family nonheme iron enzyme [Candidatus Brocadiia bacterium]